MAQDAQPHSSIQLRCRDDFDFIVFADIHDDRRIEVNKLRISSESDKFVHKEMVGIVIWKYEQLESGYVILKNKEILNSLPGLEEKSLAQKLFFFRYQKEIPTDLVATGFLYEGDAWRFDSSYFTSGTPYHSTDPGVSEAEEKNLSVMLTGWIKEKKDKYRILESKDYTLEQARALLCETTADAVKNLPPEAKKAAAASKKATAAGGKKGGCVIL